MLTGKLIDAGRAGAAADLPRLHQARMAGRLGEPVIRQAVGAGGAHHGRAVRARPHHRGGARARRAARASLCSFDMLGEGARTAADAERYERAYADAIEAVGQARRAARARRPATASRSSSRRSARATRRAQADRVWAELYPRIKRLALIAAGARPQLHHRRRGGRPAGALAEAARPRWRASPSSATGRASAWPCRPIRSARRR